MRGHLAALLLLAATDFAALPAMSAERVLDGAPDEARPAASRPSEFVILPSPQLDPATVQLDTNTTIVDGSATKPGVIIVHREQVKMKGRWKANVSFPVPREFSVEARGKLIRVTLWARAKSPPDVQMAVTYLSNSKYRNWWRKAQLTRSLQRISVNFSVPRDNDDIDEHVGILVNTSDPETTLEIYAIRGEIVSLPLLK